MSAAAVESREPARPDRVIGTFALIGPDEVDRRIAAATAAQAGWERDAPARARALHAWADAVEARAVTFADLLVREVGKPARESRGEVARAIAILRYYAQAAYDPVAEVYPVAEAGAELRVHRRPLGVVAAICPWNFPVAIPVWKLAPALAYGNTALFKPSSSALATARLLMEAAGAALPPGVLGLVAAAPGSSAALVDDPRVAGVSFTGSVAVGTDIVRRAVGRGVPAQAEMGGQNPAIILEDADLEASATMIARAAMEFAGQKCTATRRVIVPAAVADAFVPLLVDAVRGLRVGAPEDEAVDARTTTGGSWTRASSRWTTRPIPSRRRRPSARRSRCSSCRTSTRPCGWRTGPASDSRPRCTAATSIAPVASRCGWMPACSASTRRRPASTTTPRSGATRRRASGPASRAARRASSTRRRGRC